MIQIARNKFRRAFPAWRRLLANFRNRRLFREDAGEIVAGQRHDGEGEAVDFFRAQRAAGVRPFFDQRGEIGLERIALALGVQQQQQARRNVVVAVRAVDGHGEGELALRQLHEIGDLHAQIAFQRRDKLIVPLRHEFVVKRLHGRVVPEHPAGRLTWRRRARRRSPAR